MNNFEWSEKAKEYLEVWKNKEDQLIIDSNIIKSLSPKYNHFLYSEREKTGFQSLLFINKLEKKLVGLVYFGDNIEGPYRKVHGGKFFLF
jgi:hypothetical protein